MGKNIRMKGTFAIVVVIAIAMIISGLALLTETSNATSVKVGTVSLIQVKNVGKDKLKVSWNKSGKVTGVKVYQTVSGRTKIVKITRGKTYTTKALKKNKTYKYAIRPYYKKSGKTYYGKKSYSVTARTSRSTKKNVSKLKFSTYSKILTEGKAKTFKVKFYGSKLLSKTIRWSSSKTSVASVSSKGYVKAKKAGTAYIYAKAHSGKTIKIKVTVKKKVSTPATPATPTKYGLDEATQSGFFLSSFFGDAVDKTTVTEKPTSDGIVRCNVKFNTNGNVNWAKKVQFVVEDVTPTAYAKMFSDMNVKYNAPKIVYSSVQSYGNISNSPEIILPFGEGITPSRGGKAASYVSFAIEAGQSTRVIKVTAKKDNKTLDTIYYFYDGRDKDGVYNQWDLNLYKSVRNKIEAKLWKGSMSNVDKLKAVSDYINKTTHYPTKKMIKKENNPTLWKDWSVENKFLYYDKGHDVILNRIMDLQGGIVSCQAADIIERVGTEDLGLKNLYNSETDTVALGEGVWIGMGKYSSSPANPWHESLIYKDNSESKTYIDTQGLDLDSNFDCTEHKCREKIISLK